MDETVDLQSEFLDKAELREIELSVLQKQESFTNIDGYLLERINKVHDRVKNDSKKYKKVVLELNKENEKLRNIIAD